jgi:putative transposase
VFATVKHRQKKTRGNGSRAACLAMVFKLAESARRKWRALNGTALLPDVIQGVHFVNGIKQDQAAA